MYPLKFGIKQHKENLPSSDGLISLQRNNLLVRVIDLVIVIQSPKSVHSTQGPSPIYQLCVFPPNLPVVCVFPPNLPVVCVSTQFTSCVCFHPIYQLCVCFHPIHQLYVWFHPIYRLLALPSYIPVVCVCFSTLYTGSPRSDLLLLPNTDRLQQVEDSVRSSTCQVTIEKMSQLFA